MTAPFPSEIYSRRVDALAGLLSPRGIAAAVLTPGADLRYLLASDINTHERFSALVITPASRQLIVPAVDAEALRHGIPAEIGVDITAWNDGEDPYALVLDALALNSDIVIAVSGYMTADHLLNLQSQGVSTLNATTVLREVFMVKGDAEIAELRQAGAAIDRVHRRVPELLHAGRTEREIASELETLILAEHVLVDFIIVGSGPNGANPHHDVSDRVLAEGDIVVVDIGGTLASGYHSDCTRTYVVGHARPEQLEVYRVLRSAQEAGLAAARPGVTAEGLDAIVRDIITDAGYGEYYTHRTGHGIGLSGHEEPFIIAGNELPLAEGMAFSIEPGIYLPGQWGARIEDIVVLTADGCEPLNTTTHDLVTSGVHAKGPGIRDTGEES